MVNPIERKTDAKTDTRTRQNTDTAINYITASRTSGKSRPNHKSRFDELIVSLANAHENRRARQVTEWEKMLQQNLSLSM